MIIAHYVPSLPAEYDLGIIPARARSARSPLGRRSRATSGFLLRSAGPFGAIANEFSFLVY